jgi:hypothetical protein
MAFYPDFEMPDSLFALALSASASGDPHVTNVAGERFDIMQTGMHSLLEVPRGQHIPKKLLVQGKIDRVGSACALMWITQLLVSGSLLNADYEFGTKGHHTSFRVGNFSTTDIDEFAAAVKPSELSIALNNVQYHVNHGKMKNAQFTLNAGPSTLLIERHIKQGQDHLDFTARNLGSLGDSTNIGGLMGVDDHTWASTSGECSKSRSLLSSEANEASYMIASL